MSSDPSPQQIRDRLNALREALLSFHKALMDSERASYEKVHGKVESPGHMLNLLLGNAFFAWLRPYSGLVVDIDEAMASKEPVRTEQARRFFAEAARLLTTEDRPAYRAALDRDPDVVLAQADVSRVLAVARAEGF